MKIPELEAIKRLLLTEWDPIGVGDIEACHDEYDSYAMPIYSQLVRGETVGAVATYLEWVVTDQMGMSGNPEQSRRIAERLAEIHVDFSRRR